METFRASGSLYCCADCGGHPGLPLSLRGQVAVWFGLLTKLAVALLFFMHGAKLSRQNLLAGLGHWRLHLVVMLSTFVLFPLLGLLLTPLVPSWLSPAIYLGFLYLCALPATVQSAIAFTSMAGAMCRRRCAAPRPPASSASSSRRCWWG